MVIFGVKCVVIKQGGHDLYGNKIEGAKHPEKCAVVKLEKGQQNSTVRVDSGATRGGADEFRADAVLLLNKKTKAEIEDTIIVNGVILRIIKKHHRFDVLGKLDHFQIKAAIEQ